MSVDVLNGMGSGEIFTLRLADGRSLEVFFSRGDPLSGTWTMANSSPDGFAPADR
jgi:hypothetical protein